MERTERVMKEVLQTIIEALVDDKSSVQIEQIDRDRDILFEVRVSKRRHG